jgi:hypothetical protein
MREGAVTEIFADGIVTHRNARTHPRFEVIRSFAKAGPATVVLTARGRSGTFQTTTVRLKLTLDPTVLPRVQSLAPKLASSRDVAVEAAAVLRMLRSLASAPALARALKEHAHPDVRCAAVLALQDMRAVDGIPALIHALADTEPSVVALAGGALADMAGSMAASPIPPPGTELTMPCAAKELQRAWRAWYLREEEKLRAQLAQ